MDIFTMSKGHLDMELECSTLAVSQSSYLLGFHHILADGLSTAFKRITRLRRIL